MIHLVNDRRPVNNGVASGLPHSEIHGSEPIPGFPWLIAGYHVLHRLLLPRHPPNALLALDLIQKKPGFFQTSEIETSRTRQLPGRLVFLTWKDNCRAAAPRKAPKRQCLVFFCYLHDVNQSLATSAAERIWWSVPDLNR